MSSFSLTHQRSKGGGEKEKDVHCPTSLDQSGTIRSFYSGHVREDSIPDVHEAMESLKNASKDGDTAQAARAVSRMMLKGYKQEEAISHVALDHIVKVLYSPIYGTTNHRVALYYASLYGQTDLVKTYLSVLVLAGLHKRQKILAMISYKAHTMPSWLDLVGYPTDFDREQLHLCCTSALNEQTKNAIFLQEFSVQDIINQSRGWPGTGSVIECLQHGLGIRRKVIQPPPATVACDKKQRIKTPSRTVRRGMLKTKKINKIAKHDFTSGMPTKLNKTNSGFRDSHSPNKKPPRTCLQVEDVFDLTYRPDDKEGASFLSTEHRSLSSFEDPVKEGASCLLGTDGVDRANLIESIETHTSNHDDLDSDDGSSSSSAFEMVNGNVGVEMLSLEDVSASDASNTVDRQDSGWEFMTECESVISLGSVPSTYRDALILGACQISTVTKRQRVQNVFQPCQRLEKAPANARQASSLVDDEFDAFFIMEGVKGARGGRTSLMFKGNPRQT